tara:strand:+ start:961 stop:1110 length:150 start_codon:yes stop_codon:yes gene_type:complete
MIIENLIKLIKEELAASQVNKENFSDEYLIGKNEAYDKIIEEIKKELTK